MKITKRQLKQIIREEKTRMLNEQSDGSAREFEDIMGQLSELLDEAFELCGRDRTAEVYWYNTMKGCIDGRATMHTMENTLEELADGDDGEDMMELGYNDGVAGKPPAHLGNEFYMVNYEDGKRESEGRS